MEKSELGNIAQWCVIGIDKEGQFGNLACFPPGWISIVWQCTRSA